MTQDDSSNRPATPVLDRVHVPADMKDLTDRELRQLVARGRAGTSESPTEKTRWKAASVVADAPRQP